MCKLTNNIKFCTCIDDNKDIEELNHYWILHRFNKDKNELYMGMPMFPDHLLPGFKDNEELLTKALNTPEAFDTNINLKSKDRIEVVINNKSNDYTTYNYTFEYKKGQWKPIESDCFELMNRYDKLATGKLKEI
jgi:hypothetical protein